VLHLTQFSFGTVAHRKAKSTRNQCCGLALVNTAERQVNWLQVSLCRPTKQNQHNYLALRVIMTFDVAQIEVMP